ncbi:unnamed protein product [Cuscuta europaea]|uniref:Uncharacterized protein n=1 Tax=Cuscuta europaea TaxID=41803 RepID=A0A9P1E529_CUSEU|nr:unnamed protein product [Cuscuta europaea]
MNSTEPNDNSEEVETSNFRFLRSCLGRVLFLLGLFLLLIFLLCSAVYIENLPIWNPISLPSRCKIVSSSVDIRSSKVCELGLLNYKAKNVLYPYEIKKFRCHYDYYWASVFKIIRAIRVSLSLKLLMKHFPLTVDPILLLLGWQRIDSRLMKLTSAGTRWEFLRLTYMKMAFSVVKLKIHPL